MFKKILVPIDGSPNSQKALKAAVSLAKQFSSEVVALYVAEVGAYPVMPGDFIGWSASYVEETLEALRSMGQKVLDEAKQLTAKDFPALKTELEMGRAIDAICAVAEKEKCDLIVMGSRGLSDFKGFFLGSVSHGVLQRSTCPVLLIKDSLVPVHDEDSRRVVAAHTLKG